MKRKITWPSKKGLLIDTLTVVGTAAILGTVIYLWNGLLDAIVQWLLAI